MASPAVTIVSPTPGVPVGDPGGFPRSFARAKTTPIVVEITDADADIAFMMIAARFPNEQIEEDGDDPGENEEVVYRAGQFRGKYVANSYQESIPTGFRLHIGRRGGWPRGDDGQVASVVLAVEALDAGGTVEIKMDGTLVGTAEAIDFIGATVVDEGGGVVSVTIDAGGGGGSVVFDDAVEADHRNIRSDRATAQSPIDNTKVGVTNLGNKTNVVASTGATANHSTIGGGDDNTASGDYSTVPGGNRNVASGESSFATNFRNTASGGMASCFGYTNTCAGDTGFACGENNTITAQGDGGAFVSGQANTVSGDGAHAEGRGHNVSGDYAHAEGRDGIASGTASHTEGDSCHATNGSAHAEGTSTTASGANAHSEGSSTTASGANSHAEGIGTSASGSAAHAEGNACVASGFNSRASGRLCSATASYAQASGYYAKASRETQAAYASGRFAAQGDAQTSVIVMRGGGALVYGESASDVIALEANKCYAFRVHCMAGGGPDGTISAYIVRDFIVRTDGSSTTVVASGIQSIIGHATAVANWTVTASSPGGFDFKIFFSMNADVTTTNVNAVARVEFIEGPNSP